MNADVPPVAIDLARRPDFALGSVAVRPSRRELAVGAERHILEPRVMQVLVALSERGGEVVSRDELIAACWAGRIVGDDAINACVAKVRRLGERFAAYAVETVPRVGYRFVAADRGGPAIAPAEPRLLAVLPFENRSDDPDLGYFSDGVAEEILNAVAQRTAIKVIGRASSFQFRGAEKIVGRVAQELHASHVLDGTVRRSGERVRVTAQLVETRRETIVWSDRFDAALPDIFGVQDEIAGAVAAALSVVFRPGAPSAPVDPAAYDLYLKAQASTVNWLGGRDSLLLEAAVARAPDFGPAWASLALALATRGIGKGIGEAGDDLRRRARIAANRALAFDAHPGLAHVALSLLHPECGAFERRDADLACALAASPNEAWVLLHACQAAEKVGRVAEGHAYAARARQLQPVWPQGAILYASTLDDMGRHAEAEEAFDLARQRWPDIDYCAIGRIFRLAHAGRFEKLDDALADLKANGPFTESTAAAIRNVEAVRRPDPARAARWLAEERARIAGSGMMRLDLALLCRDGQADAAYALVEQATFANLFRPGGRSVGYDLGLAGLFMSFARPMRADPRFTRLCAKLGLAQYWIAAERWPDCADDRSLPYDFRAECRRATEA